MEDFCVPFQRVNSATTWLISTSNCRVKEYRDASSARVKFLLDRIFRYTRNPRAIFDDAGFLPVSLARR